jgi:predicted deacylase
MTMSDSSTTYPIELEAPDIRRWATGNTGLAYVHTFASSKPGPHVAINAVTHGNEICGAIAVDRLLAGFSKGEWSIARGTLSLAFANVDAYQRFSAADPFATRFVDEDFNRVWSSDRLDGPAQSSELRRARAMRPWLETVDLLFDIHSMLEPSPPVMICGPLEKGIALSREVGIPHWIVADKGHANGTRMRDYAGFGDAKSAKNALLIECGQHWERKAASVAWTGSWRFLQVTGAVTETEALAATVWDSAPLPATTQVVRVTEAVVARSAEFRFARNFAGMERVAKAGDLIAMDGADEVRAPYDDCVLVMPVPHHVKHGLTAVRLGRLEQ